jgi:N-acetylmuramoyl-L-alanine amidase
MRIVINPGHSEQYDPGAVAADGLTEAWVVTQIARQMGALGGYELKRQGRLLLPMLLGLRVNKPDLLVSLHCNAPSRNLHECHAYWWRQEPDLAVHRESERLATIIAGRAQGTFAEWGLVKTFPIVRENGRLLTPGVLVRTAKRAAVLVELGFISDPHVAAAMRTANWQGRVVCALDAAIREWAL